MALVFHELATNAAKYGARSTEEGSVDIQCTAADDVLKIVWRESGGPKLDKAPERIGFGTRLAQMSIEQQLGGEIAREWARDGLRVTLTVRSSSLAR